MSLIFDIKTEAKAYCKRTGYKILDGRRVFMFTYGSNMSEVIWINPFRTLNCLVLYNQVRPKHTYLIDKIRFTLRSI